MATMVHPAAGADADSVDCGQKQDRSDGQGLLDPGSRFYVNAEEVDEESGEGEHEDSKCAGAHDQEFGPGV